mgnify:CR=1 FL=1
MNEIVAQEKPTALEIMKAQRKREDYLEKIDSLNKDDKAISVPVNDTDGTIADIFQKYNKARKNRIAPVLDQILPAGELPEEYFRNIQYGN